MSKIIQQTLKIPDELKGSRLDQALTQLLTSYSRTEIQNWIKNAEITMDNKPLKAKQLVKGGETITVFATPKTQPSYAAEPIPLDIIYEDDCLLLINKPKGLVVHPAAGHYHNTLLNALLHHEPSLQELPRAGIVHRLDKDTSGLLVIAKNAIAFKSLTKQLKAHSIIRLYQAIVLGTLVSGGTVDLPIGRHPIQRKRMCVTETGKPAITHFRVMEKYPAHTLLKIQLETGRTHQIRVHMAHIHHPILGDPTYGKRLQLPKGASVELINQLRGLKSQALHAFELTLMHPVAKTTMTFHAPLPHDMKEILETLRKSR